MSSDIVEIRYSITYNESVDKDIKLACLSDIHISDRTSMEDVESIVRIIDSEKPDYILLLGDVLDSVHVSRDNSNRLKCISLIMKLASISNIYFVLGNHDYINYGNENRYRIEETDIWDIVKVLNNVNFLDNEIIEKKDIIIGGYNEPYNMYYEKDKGNFIKDIEDNKLNIVTGDKPKLFLMHTPEPLEKDENVEVLKDYDYIFCGHYHNGCVPSFLNKIWLPKHSGVVTPSKQLFPKNVRGIKKLKTGSYLFYNGGWVKIAENTPDYLHFLDKMCNRQLDITTITPDNKYKKIKTFTKKTKK